MRIRLIMTIAIMAIFSACTAPSDDPQEPILPTRPPATLITFQTPTPADTPAPDSSPTVTIGPASTVAQSDIDSLNIQPCYLIPVTAIEPITGEAPFGLPGTSPVSAYPDTQETSSACNYDPLVYLTLRTYPPGSQAMHDQFAALSGDPVEDIGDQATWDGYNLTILDGEAWLSLTVNPGATDEEKLDMARHLAAIALERLDAALDGKARLEPPPDFDACQLMTVAEAEGILGVQVGAPMPLTYTGWHTAGDYLNCEFYGQTSTASVSYYHYASPEAARWDFDTQTGLGENQPVDLGDAADEALWSYTATTSPYYSLYILTGTDVIVIGNILTDTLREDLPLAQQVALIVLNHLPE